MRHATEVDREEWWLSLFYNKNVQIGFFYACVGTVSNLIATFTRVI